MRVWKPELEEDDGAFYITKDGRNPEHYDILIDEHDKQSLLVFDGLTEAQARHFCSRLNKAVARYMVNDHDPE